jgi:BirA family biotin operon repressor/biotin-[acetyl-CoA-carboxylase] ligase
MAPTPEQVETIQQPRPRGRFGKPYIWRRVCESTQELARDLPEGGVAACDEQTAGRGRRGREWCSPPGAGLLFSLALEPHTAPDRLPAFSLVAAEAVCTVCDPRAMVRWPNDVVIEGRKVAGVLPELRDSKLVVGFGVNVNQTPSGLPEQARVSATSLRIERGGEVDRVELLVNLLDELERCYDAFERDGFTGLDRDELRGRAVQLVGGHRGLCQGVDELGRLIVDGHAHTSAEVERVEMM